MTSTGFSPAPSRRCRHPNPRQQRWPDDAARTTARGHRCGSLYPSGRQPGGEAGRGEPGQQAPGRHSHCAHELPFPAICPVRKAPEHRDCAFVRRKWRNWSLWCMGGAPRGHCTSCRPGPVSSRAPSSRRRRAALRAARGQSRRCGTARRACQRPSSSARTAAR